MKAVMISIKPEWVEKILNGEKTIEIRKTIPKCELPCKVYIYCTKNRHLACVVNKNGAKLFYTCNNETAFIAGGYLGNGKVVAEFTLNKFWEFDPFGECTPQWKYLLGKILGLSRLSQYELFDYLGAKKGYALYIDNLKIYDKPKELSKSKLTKAPQSWCYVEELEAK